MNISHSPSQWKSMRENCCSVLLKLFENIFCPYRSVNYFLALFACIHLLPQAMGRGNLFSRSISH